MMERTLHKLRATRIVDGRRCNDEDTSSNTPAPGSPAAWPNTHTTDRSTRFIDGPNRNKSQVTETARRGCRATMLGTKEIDGGLQRREGRWWCSSMAERERVRERWCLIDGDGRR
ncbi:hypothetical protein E3N88_04741 [Mikania micrantha]|uniref:Uncharacterized protein n=1 Tax=Mikania micrantha TaxID=192012 RepID=A0A5N6PW72_9ASTR|nr:hypothetical protein E3N88_04741 [Mikania micrantha]